MQLYEYNLVSSVRAVLPTLHGYPTAPTRGSPSDRKSSQNSSLHAQLYPTVTHEANICSKELMIPHQALLSTVGEHPKDLNFQNSFCKDWRLEKGLCMTLKISSLICEKRVTNSFGSSWCCMCFVMFCHYKVVTFDTFVLFHKKKTQ